MTDLRAFGMSIFANFLGTMNFRIKNFEEKCMPESPNKSSKIGVQFTAISDSQIMRSVFYFSQGIGK